MLLLQSMRALGLPILPLLGKVSREVSEDADEGEACTKYEGVR